MTQKNYHQLADSTKEEYLTQSENLLKRELDSNNIERTAGNICKALINWSKGKKANTYRKMRSALAYHQFSKKYYQAATAIESTQRIGYGEKSGKKKAVCKFIKEDEHQKLLTAAKEKGDKQSESALILAYYLGVRPAEMTNILPVDMGDGLLEVNIDGAKKSVTRSMDKTLYLEFEQEEKQHVLNAINTLAGISINERKAMQKRVSRLSKKLFFRRKLRPTLYSYRHQMASDAKGLKTSSGKKVLTRKQASAIMGHKAQASLSAYGHANSASGLKRSLPIPSEETVEQVLDNSENKNYLTLKFKQKHQIPSTAENTENEQQKQEAPKSGNMADFIRKRLLESSSLDNK